MAKKDAYNALRDFNEPKIQATPRNALMGYLADAIAGVDDYAQRVDNTMPMGKANPVLSILSNAFGIPGTARTLDRLSYGEPVTNYGKANVPLIPDDTTDALMMGAGAVSGAARMAPQAARIARIAADNARAPSTVPRLGERGAVVYHGSPHKFDAFDASKIGTGEGAQAYGHGLYLAESLDVAGTYAKTSPKVVSQDGKAYFRVIGKPTHEPQLYSVDLPDEKIARMLDWDKPLSQQAPEVQAAIERIKQSLTGPFSSDMTGDRLLAHIQQTLKGVGQGDVKAEQMLRQQGIPGIRYLDGGSRTGGAGTSNFVVFPGEENALRILERNGQKLR